MYNNVNDTIYLTAKYRRILNVCCNTNYMKLIYLMDSNLAIKRNVSHLSYKFISR